MNGLGGPFLWTTSLTVWRNSHEGNQKGDIFDLDALLHPASAFAHPMEVVHDPDLTLNEKRAILAWASDASALEAAPDLRVNTSGNVVHWDEP